MIPDLLRICCAMKAKTVCDGVFLSRRDQRAVEREDLGFHPLFRFARAVVDRAVRSVSCSLLGTGLFRATAIFVEGIGAVLLSGEPEDEVRARLRMPDAAEADHPSDAPWPLGDGERPGAPPPGTDQAGLSLAVDRLFADPERGRKVRTRAVLVVQDDRILAERYAPGIGPETPLLGWSMAKSVVAVLAGILVARGKLRIDDPLAAPEWQDRDDPRGGLTTHHLLTMCSGLRWREAYEDDPVTDVERMLFLEPDMAAHAAGKPRDSVPGTVLRYSSGSTNIVCRHMRQTMGDLAAYLSFPRRELFSRIGMRSATLATDASGTFIGSSYLYATDRDYARFGMFCLNDGVWAGRRILPEGWMRYLTSPTPAASRGEYGASLWLNRGAPGDPASRTYPRLPRDLYYASGHQGQAIMVVPSRRLVVVRLGMSWDSDWGAEDFMAAVLAALPQ